jgi:nucleoside 2-deoxyribosyltransferase
MLFTEKADRLLLYMVQKTDILGRRINLFAPPHEIGAVVETFDSNEVGFIAKHLEVRGWAKDTSEQFLFTVTGDGFSRAEELQKLLGSSSQGFVAMWFNDALTDAWENGFRQGILKAGYAPQRIDKKEHTNKICDEIIAEIRRSRFVVADFTGHRGGVYFEAGFAQGLGLPVVWTCRKADLGDLHFDIRQYSCIDWDSPEELSSRLSARISATIGDGPYCFRVK